MDNITKANNLNKINERELTLHGGDEKKSWHKKHSGSAWIYIGGLPFDLTEGDVICVFSQYGEVVNINLIRDRETGKSRGFGFLCYEDQRSTILAVDNFNGIKINGRVIRVDHVDNYRPQKVHINDSEETKLLKREGCAPDKLKAFEELRQQQISNPPSMRCDLTSTSDNSDSRRMERARAFVDYSEFALPEPAVMYGPAEPPPPQKKKK